MRLLLYYVVYWGTSIIIYYGENELAPCAITAWHGPCMQM